MEKVGQKTWRGILVYLEWEGEAFHPVSYELLRREDYLRSARSQYMRWGLEKKFIKESPC